MPTAYLEELAAEYGQAVENANQRLGDFVNLAVQGYRDEALEIAERKPELSHVVSQLDFPELGQWQEMLFENMIGAPPTIRMEAASALDDAYEQRLKLAPLMAAHRKLALSQAPLRARIDVIRILTENDPTNPLWPAELESYEHTRIDQIKRELKLAIQDGELDTIRELYEELSGKPWSVKLPKALLKEAAGAEGKQAQFDAKKELADLTEQLNLAWAAFDEPLGLELAQRWNDVNQTANLQTGDETFDAAQDALAWAYEVSANLDREQNFERALIDLENALDDRVPVDQFERILYTAQSFEREIPKSLSRRAQEYRSRLQASARRSRIAIAASAFIAIGILAAVLAWYLVNQQKGREIQNGRDLMARLNGRENLQAAEDFFASAPKHVQADGEIVEHLNRLREERRTETSRREEFESVLNQMDFSGPLDQRAQRTVERLEPLAVSDEEKRQFAALVSQLETERLNRQNQRNQLFQSRFDDLRNRLANISSGVTTENLSKLQDLERELELFAQEPKNMIDGLPAVSSRLVEQIPVLQRQISGRVELVKRDMAAQERIAQLGKALPNVGAFSQALSEFASTYPSNSLSGSFRTAAGRKDQHEAFATWKNLARRPGWRELAKQTPEQALQLKTDLEAALSRISLSGTESSTMATKLVLEQMHQQQISPQLLTECEEFRKYFDRSDFTRQHIAITKGGDEKWHYLKEAPKVMEAKSGAPPNIKLVTYKDLTKVDSTTAFPELDTIAHHGLAGQCTIKEQVDRLLVDTKPLGRDRLLYELMKTLAAETKSPDGVPPDPILQALMIEKGLEVVANHGVLTKEFANKWTRRFKTIDVRSIDWMDHRKSRDVLNPMRKQLSELIQTIRGELGGVEISIGAMEESRRAIPNWIDQFEFEVAGWICQQDGKYVFYPVRDGLDRCTLLGFQDSQQDLVKLVPIGRCESGLLLDISDINRLYSGQIVYIANEASEVSSQN